jgi:hypothetical protein
MVEQKKGVDCLGGRNGQVEVITDFIELQERQK